MMKYCFGIVVFFSLFLFGGVAPSYAANSGITAPSGPTPSNGGTASIPVTLRWQESTFPSAIAHSYIISSGFTNNQWIWVGNSPSYTISNDLIAGKPYSWIVRGCIGSGFPSNIENDCGPQGGPWIFTPTLAQPILVSPANNSVAFLEQRSHFGSIHLIWNQVAGVAINYKVFLNTGNFSQPLEFTSSTNDFWINPNLIVPNQTYTWSVKAVAGASDGPSSETWTFTALAQLFAPVIVSPANNQEIPTSTLPFIFKWNRPSTSFKGSFKYDWSIFLTSTNTKFANGSVIDTTQVSVNNIPNGSYAFQVAASAQDGSGLGPPSVILFSVKDNQAPEILAFDIDPKGDAVEPPVTISWDVKDIGGSHLKNGEVWRSNFSAQSCSTGVESTCNWGSSPVATVSAPLNSDRWNSSTQDSPADGTYWYGIHVNDNNNNSITERARFSPLKVGVVRASSFLTISSQNPIDFGTVQQGQTSTRETLSEIILLNFSNAPIKVSVVVSGNGFALGTIPEFTIDPGKQQEVEISFDASGKTPGVFQGNVRMTSAGISGGVKDIQLLATVTSSAVQPASLIISSQDPIDFGTLKQGQTNTRASDPELILLNPANSASPISGSISVSGTGYVLHGSSSFTIQPGQSQEVHILFEAPFNGGTFPGTATIKSSSLTTDKIISLTALVEESVPLPPETNDVFGKIRTFTNWAFTGLLILAVFMVLVAAFQFITSQGDPNQISTAKSSLIWAATGVVLALFAKGVPIILQSIVGSGTPGTEPTPGQCLANQICNPLKTSNFADVLNTVTNLIFTLAIVITPLLVIAAAFLLVSAQGDPKQITKARNMLLFTILGFLVILMSKGIIVILKSALGI